MMSYFSGTITPSYVDGARPGNLLLLGDVLSLGRIPQCSSFVPREILAIDYQLLFNFSSINIDIGKYKVKVKVWLYVHMSANYDITIVISC